jgi:hypothetical protein
MPVRAGAGGTIVEVRPESRTLEYAYAGWIDPTTREWSLVDADQGYFLAAGVAGLGSQPITLSTAARSRGGVGINSTRYEPRILTLPLHVYGKDQDSFLPRWDELEDAFTRTTEEGLGTLRLVRPNGSERRIDGVYYAGWDNGAGDDWSYDTVPLQLYCPRGYFYDPVPVVVVRAGSAAGSSFFGPYPRVSSGRTLGNSTLVNSGQLTTYADWTIVGPMTGITATITRPDGITETFTITHTLTVGQTVRIFSDPPRILDDDDNSLLNALTLPGSTLWGIPRGTSAVDFAVAGSTADTLVTLSFLKRYKKA